MKIELKTPENIKDLRSGRLEYELKDLLQRRFDLRKCISANHLVLDVIGGKNKLLDVKASVTNNIILNFKYSPKIKEIKQINFYCKSRQINFGVFSVPTVNCHFETSDNYNFMNLARRIKNETKDLDRLVDAYDKAIEKYKALIKEVKALESLSPYELFYNECKDNGIMNEDVIKGLWNMKV